MIETHEIVVLEYSTGTLFYIHDVPKNLTTEEVEAFLGKKLKLEDCYWMTRDNTHGVHVDYQDFDKAVWK